MYDSHWLAEKFQLNPTCMKMLGYFGVLFFTLCWHYIVMINIFWSDQEYRVLIYWSSPGCISLLLLVAFNMPPWAVLNCGGAWSCCTLWALLWQSTGQAVQCHLDESFPPDAALTWWALILQERLPQAAAAFLRGPDPLQCPALQSHPLFSQQAQPVPISSLSLVPTHSGCRAEGSRRI